MTFFFAKPHLLFCPKVDFLELIFFSLSRREGFSKLPLKAEDMRVGCPTLMLKIYSGCR